MDRTEPVSTAPQITPPPAPPEPPATAPVAAPSVATTVTRRARVLRGLRAFGAFIVSDLALSAVAVLIASLLLARAQAFFLASPSPVAFDDGYTVALGERLIDHHWLPYVDGCSHRGPLLYWSVAIAQKLSGRFNWFGPRWLEIFLSFGSVLGMVVASVATRRYVMGAIAALVYVYVMSIFEVGPAYGVLGETVAAPFVVWSLTCAALGIISARSFHARAAWLILAGIAAGLAGLAKQTALATIGPVALWALFAALAQSDLSRGRRALLAAAAPIGFLAVVAVTLFRYAINGALGAFWYWYYTYNTQVYMHPFKAVPFRREFDGLFGREHWVLLALLLTTIAAVGGYFSRVARAEKKLACAGGPAGFELCLGLLMFVIFAGAAAPMRFWNHYFLAMFPLGALLAGAGVDRALEGTRGNRGLRFLALLTTLGSLTAFTLYAADLRNIELNRQRRGGSWSGVKPEPICDYIDQHSTKDAFTFIWGFDSDLYVTCGRKPATRFLYLTLVAGTVPGGSWQDIRPERVARGSRQHIIEDLNKTQPPVILDMPGNMGGVSLQVVPELVQLTNRDYCRQPPIRSKNGRMATPYLRKQAAVCPP